MQQLGRGSITYGEDVDTLDFDWGRIKFLSEPAISASVGVAPGLRPIREESSFRKAMSSRVSEGASFSFTRGYLALGVAGGARIGPALHGTRVPPWTFATRRSELVTGCLAPSAETTKLVMPWTSAGRPVAIVVHSTGLIRGWAPTRGPTAPSRRRRSKLGSRPSPASTLRLMA